jgi:oligo-1,6-glucosidase
MDIITLGSYELLLPDDPDLFVYTRKYGKEELLVICNFSHTERRFELPERFIGKDLLVSNEESITGKPEITLGAFGAKVFYIHIT